MKISQTRMRVDSGSFSRYSYRRDEPSDEGLDISIWIGDYCCQLMNALGEFSSIAFRHYSYQWPR
ncbi:MAG: hypothetical protein ACXACD_05280, partial [Candidatus Thorarchaeota archaeon]